MPCSVSDAAAFYRAEEGSLTEKVFWSQYAEAEHPMPLSDQLKQLVELHKVAEQAMKGLIVRLWPGEAMPGSNFGLVRRLVEAYPRLEVIKRSVCIVLGNVAEIQNFLRITKINLWSNLATRGRRVHLHTLVDR